VGADGGGRRCWGFAGTKLCVGMALPIAVVSYRFGSGGATVEGKAGGGRTADGMLLFELSSTI
jgi:hypothetical protein